MATPYFKVLSFEGSAGCLFKQLTCLSYWCEAMIHGQAKAAMQASDHLRLLLCRLSAAGELEPAVPNGKDVSLRSYPTLKIC